MSSRKTASFLFAALFLGLMAGCGETRTTGFYAGATTTRATSRDTSDTIYTETTFQTSPEAGDTLLNCTFQSVLSSPFGPDCRYEVYNDAMHIDNSAFDDPVVLLSTAGLLGDGLVQARFDIVNAPSHCVVGLVIRAESTEDFILLGVNSRGQYTVQRSIRGLWLPVMGLDPFESSRLLAFSPGEVELSALVHGNYIDFMVNGQLIQVVRTDLPPIGQAGVFVDGYAEVNLDRITVVPSE
ncbi:MAG: hypothetical protein R6U39_11890 [Candidatus Aegiribacteria sp.]